jgi:uncharacterized repeat protein (TIGR01451 family)
MHTTKLTYEVRWSLALILALGLWLLRQPLAVSADGPIYVDADASGTATGLSWTNAFTNIQDALSVAGIGSEIWVAEGVYYPDEGAGQTNNARTSTFTITESIALYGGFAATETLRTQRDWVAHPTVLSGDLDGDGTSTGNAYHVLWLDGVHHPDITGATVIDGFTITAARADGGSIHSSGGGLYCAGYEGNECSPTLTNLIFSDNLANVYGAGMYCDGSFDGKSSPTLTYVTFSGNDAGYGGGMYNDGSGDEDLGYRSTSESNPTLTDVTFVGNRAHNGGGMYNDGTAGMSSPALTGVTFTRNVAHGYNGGGMHNQGYYTGESSPTLTNVTFISNSAMFGGGMYNYAYEGTTSPRLTNVIFSGNASDYGGGMYNMSYREAFPKTARCTPILINVLFSGNSARYYGGGINNGSLGADDARTAATLINVTFSGNSAQYGGGMSNRKLDIGATVSTLVNCILWGNTAISNGLQIYNEGVATTTVLYSIVEGGYGGTGNLAVDPQFVAPIAASSAPTSTGNFRLSLGSLAIDAGTNAGCPAFDLGGLIRPLDGDEDGTATCDMGAYEFEKPRPALSLAKSVSPAAAVPYHGTVTYTLSFSNTGTLSDTAAMFTDTLPTGMTFGSWVMNPGAVAANNRITWTGTLPDQTALTFTFTALHTGSSGGVITNTAYFSGALQAGCATAAVTVVAAGYSSTPAPGSTIDVGRTGVGSPVTATLTLRETGNLTLTVPSHALSGANAADFAVTPATLSIPDGGAAQTLRVRCVPQALGLRVATLTVHHNAQGSPATYTLTCNGVMATYLPVILKNAP